MINEHDYWFPVGLPREVQQQTSRTCARIVMSSDQVSSLLPHLYTAHVTCLNESPSHGIRSIVGSDKQQGGYLESEVDPELLIHLPFNQPVRLKSISIKSTSSPSHGPRTIKLFINHPNLDFSDAADEQATQEVELSEQQLAGAAIDLRFVRFQNVNNLYILVVDNQGDEETTRIDSIDVIGTVLHATSREKIKAMDDE